MSAVQRCAVVFLLLRGIPAEAHFESSEVGSRALALGNNFVSVADDASSLYWNPAGLVRLPRHEALFSYEHNPDLDDVQRSFAAVALHSPVMSFGAGWSSFRVADALREDLVYLSVSRLLIRRSLGAFISGGATLKFAHVGIETRGFEDVAGLRGGQTKTTADLGVLMAPIPNVSFGVIVRNLGRPQFDLLAGGEKTTLLNETEWGLSFRWRPDAVLHFSRVTHARRQSESKVGIEFEIGSLLNARVGVGRDLIAGGVGIEWQNWGLDSSFQANEILGLSTRVGLRFRFGKERGDMGGEFDDF